MFPIWSFNDGSECFCMNGEKKNTPESIFHTFKLTTLQYSIISIRKHKRCQRRTFSNLWHFLFWLEHQTLANILKIYILYINILESYLWTLRRIQMFKRCHSHGGISEVAPLLFTPHSATLSGFSSSTIIKSIKTEWTQPSSDRGGNICTPVLSAVLPTPPPHGRSDGTTQWMCNDLQWGLLMCKLHV